MMPRLFQNWEQKKNISREEMDFFLRSALSGQLTMSDQLCFFERHEHKGITAEELVFAVEILQTNKQTTESFDVCGTGGSGLPRINTSTLAAFVLAAAGLAIGKHGNKASSGRFGSFDLLEKMGINITLSRQKSEEILKKIGLGFFFAPKCFPEMAAFGEARRAFGRPTLFNLLGPLLSPSNPRRQLIGTVNEKNARILRDAATKLGREKLWVVIGYGGLDEICPAGENHIFDESGNDFFLSPNDFGLSSVSMKALFLEKEKEKISFAFDFLEGKNIDSPAATLILMNAAAALIISEKENDLKKAFDRVRNVVVEKKAGEKYEAYKKWASIV